MTDHDKHAEKRQRNRVLKETRAAGDGAWTAYEERRREADAAYKRACEPSWTAYQRAKQNYDETQKLAGLAYHEAMADAKANYVAMTGSPLRGRVKLP